MLKTTYENKILKDAERRNIKGESNDQTTDGANTAAGWRIRDDLHNDPGNVCQCEAGNTGGRCDCAAGESERGNDSEDSLPADRD